MYYKGSDGHVSSYELLKVAEYVFEEDIKKKQNKNKKFSWNKQLIEEKFDELKFNYDDFMNSNDLVLKDSLESLVKYGFMIVKNVRTIINSY